MYDDGDFEEMNKDELFIYCCDNDDKSNDDYDGNSNDDYDGKLLCDAFFNDEDCGLMNSKELKEEHKKLGIIFDGRWGHKNLAKKLKKNTEKK